MQTKRCSDATDINKSEEALKQSEAHYRHLFNNIEDGFQLVEVIRDAKGVACDFRYLEVNSAYERQTGLKASQVVGKLTSEAVPNFERTWLDVFGKVERTGKPAKLENFGKAKGRFYQTFAFKFGKNQVGVFFRDITESKKAEKALKESQKRFQDIVETTSDLIYEMDAVGNFTYLNSRVEELWGVRAKDVIGRNFFEQIQTSFDGKSQDKVLETLKSAIDNPKPLKCVEIFFVDPKGKLVITESNVNPFFDENGRLLGWRGVSRDITERKKAEENSNLQTTIQQGARRILEAALKGTREELGEVCLLVAEEITKSKFGFIGELNPNGLEDIAISNPGWDACKIIAAGGHRKPPGNFKIHGIYGRVLSDGKSLYTNDAVHHPDSIGLPKGHPPLKSFLGVPLKSEDRTIGMIAVGNKDGGFNEQDLNLLESIAPYIVEAFARKKAEEALKESEERFSKAFHASPAAMSISYLPNGVLEDANENFTKLTGYRKEEIVGHTPFELNLVPYNAEESRLFLKTGKLLNQEVEVRTKDHKPLTVLMSAIVVKVGDKNYVITQFVDITERKKAEEALKLAQQKIGEYTNNLEKLVKERTKKIEEAEQRYRELYESFGEAFIAIDWELNVIHWNKAAERVTTVKAEDALSKKIYEVLPEFMSVDVTPYFEALRDRKPARFMMNAISRETKKPSLFEVSTYPSSQGIIIIVEDKTEEEQTKRLSAIGATAGMVGHDIRNPLQAMISDVYLMQSELSEMPQCATKEGVKESLNSLESNILYVNKIVGDLQDYTRPLQLHRTRIEVTDKVNNALKNVRIPENIRSHVNTQKGLVVETDPDYLRRALTNLINNAVQAMPNGGDLTIEAKAKNNKVLFTVQDTGVGIPEKAKPHLFIPLFTTKSKGQGLGLAVVKRLTEAMKGTISFESEEGKGTKFTIKLPIDSK